MNTFKLIKNKKPFLWRKCTLYEREGIKVESSAAAGFAGPGFITDSMTGKDYLARNKIDPKNITHVIWTTGGSMEPEEEFLKNYREVHF